MNAANTHKITQILICLLLTGGSAFASDSTQISPTFTQHAAAVIWCCEPNAPTFTQKYSIMDHGPSRAPSQNCQEAQTGGAGADHVGYPTAVMSAVFVDRNNAGNPNIGAVCGYITQSQYCSWKTTATCASSATPSPNPPPAQTSPDCNSPGSNC